MTTWIEYGIKADGTFSTCNGCNWLKNTIAPTSLIPVYYGYIIGYMGHANGLVDGNQPGPDLRRELVYVHGHDIDEADPLCLELGQLLGPVASGEDSCIDRGVEGLHLAAGDRLGSGQFGNGPDLNPFIGQGLARAFGREYLDAQGDQVACERADALAACHREQGSHQADLHIARGPDRPFCAS